MIVTISWRMDLLLVKIFELQHRAHRQKPTRGPTQGQDSPKAKTEGPGNSRFVI